MLVKAIIPFQTMTLFECKAANKLCVDFGNLEKLMRRILSCINPIAKFLSGPKFKDEAQLLSNFFENLVAFMKKLPKIKRNRLEHVHNLSKFITLTNPI